jgi:hypothetical protein
MKFEREQPKFRPITLTIQSEYELNFLIDALQIASDNTSIADLVASCNAMEAELQKLK